MSIEVIKKIKKLLLVLLTLLLFVGFQISTNRYGETATFFEASVATLIGIGLFTLLGSDWAHSYLINKNMEINYYYFQLFSLFIIVVVSIIIAMATYNGL